MVLDIIKEGDDRLVAENAEVTNIEEVKDLIEDMKETLLKANKNGLGLAAPQVGVNKRVLIMRKGIASQVTPLRMKPLFAMVNPIIVKRYPEAVYYREGCLSVADHLCDVKRNKEIKVKYMQEDGTFVTTKFSGVDAVVAQHEIDHLDAILMSHESRAVNMIPIQKQEVSEEKEEIKTE